MKDWIPHGVLFEKTPKLLNVSHVEYGLYW